jgi:hypothetical protein
MRLVNSGVGTCYRRLTDFDSPIRPTGFLSERYGHYPHGLASLPQSQINEHLIMIVPAARG